MSEHVFILQQIFLDAAVQSLVVSAEEVHATLQVRYLVEEKADLLKPRTTRGRTVPAASWK